MQVGGLITTRRPDRLMSERGDMMSPVTTAPSAPAPSFSARIHSLNRPNVVSVGTIIWLSSELMFFAGLFAMYFVARAAERG